MGSPLGLVVAGQPGSCAESDEWYGGSPCSPPWLRVASAAAGRAALIRRSAEWLVGDGRRSPKRSFRHWRREVILGPTRRRTALCELADSKILARGCRYRFCE